MTDSVHTPLREIAALFLRLGATSFGGPAAHIALMENEVVRRLGWMTREEFLDLLGATNLIPGPNSTEMAIHVGHRRAGMAGLVVAGAAFILPAALIVTAVAWAYVAWGRLPAAEGLLRGVKPVVLAVVAQALLGLGRSALRSRALTVIAAASVAAAALGANELAVLAAAGAAGVSTHALRGGKVGAGALLPPFAAAAPAALAGAAAPVTLGQVFLVFAKIGSVLYGSGYVLLAFLRSDLVERLGWLTEAVDLQKVGTPAA